jgi:hypothetical protein
VGRTGHQCRWHQDHRARTQVAIGVIEYLILIGFAVWGLTWVISHHAGALHFSASWFNPTGVGDKGDLVVLVQVGLQGVTSYKKSEQQQHVPAGLHRRSNRRRVVSNWRDMLTIGILPIAAVGFLGYVAVKSILSAPAAQNYSLLGFVVVGFILIFVARFGWKSEFFRIRRERLREPRPAPHRQRQGLRPRSTSAPGMAASARWAG